MASPIYAPEPPADCNLCPRLVAYRISNQQAEPSWFNGAVPSVGPVDCRLLIVGLAPGRTGANRTGRPFTGDFAGDLLYRTVSEFGFARGSYAARIDDGFELDDCMVSNAVRCAPPENKPTTAEIKLCRGFLSARIADLAKLRVVLALGRIAHEQTLSALDLPRPAFPFAHAARHALPGGLILFDSYHCSRYNTNTGRLTEEMFRAVFAAIREELDA
ncbi:MAG: uracil-DNA glycosylase [Alphaproteobacteria bacterium BRH_c36]|nr:MAG: uracil-DNA glycosylase [Alphaproteobacteria bacterium BRH_c36]